VIYGNLNQNHFSTFLAYFHHPRGDLTDIGKTAVLSKQIVSLIPEHKAYDRLKNLFAHKYISFYGALINDPENLC